MDLLWRSDRQRHARQPSGARYRLSDSGHADGSLDQRHRHPRNAERRDALLAHRDRQPRSLLGVPSETKLGENHLHRPLRWGDPVHRRPQGPGRQLDAQRNRRGECRRLHSVYWRRGSRYDLLAARSLVLGWRDDVRD